MQINPTLWPPYTDGYPGGPVTMVDLTDVDMDPCELILNHSDGFTEITPTLDHIYDGFFTLALLKGDANWDGIVNIKGATLVGLYWLQTVPPTPANVDLNSDGVINIKDATIIGIHWLEHV